VTSILETNVTIQGNRLNVITKVARLGSSPRS
jgi:hypothetical protein